MKPSDARAPSETRDPELDPETLIPQAGAMPPLPQLDFDDLAAPARVAWQATVRRRRARHRRRALSVAAVLLAVIGAFWWLRRAQPIGAVTGYFVADLGGPREVFEPLEVGEVVESGDRRLLLSFGAGHRLRVDRGSRLTIVSEVEMGLDQGAIFIDAAPGPLTVVTPQAQVGHIGTRYEIRVRGDRTRARVREGRVRLAGDKANIEIHRGEGAEIDGEGFIETHTLSTFGDPWGWIDETVPPFNLERPTLGDVVRWAAAETGRELEVSPELLLDERGEAVRVSGAPKGKRPRETLELVLAGSGLELQVEKDRWSIRPAPEVAR